MQSGMPCGRKCEQCGALVYAYHVASPFVPPHYEGIDNPVFRWEFICWYGHHRRDQPQQLSLFTGAED